MSAPDIVESEENYVVADKTFATSDLPLAGYIKFRGLMLIGHRPAKGDPRKLLFIFRDENGVGESLAVDFANSESRAFDDHVRNLKKLARMRR